LGRSDSSFMQRSENDRLRSLGTMTPDLNTRANDNSADQGRRPWAPEANNVCLTMLLFTILFKALEGKSTLNFGLDSRLPPSHFLVKRICDWQIPALPASTPLEYFTVFKYVKEVSRMAGTGNEPSGGRKTGPAEATTKTVTTHCGIV
jgi:hypothetical protein